MHHGLVAQLERAKKLITELETEYDKSLESKEVSINSQILTHEIFEKLSNILDQVARKIWTKNISSHLTDADRRKARVYFPKSDNRDSFNSTLGRWGTTEIHIISPETFNFLLSKQPFSSTENGFLSTLGKLAAQKHIDLIPQKKEEVTHVKISSQFGTVHLISEHVQFGSGVSILGAPVDPTTQRIIPTPGVEEKVEKWVSFMLQDYDLNALEFCKKSYEEIKKIIEEASSLM